MNVYNENIKKYNARTLKLTKVLNRISFLRLVIFVVSGIILISLFSKELFTPFFIVLPVSILSFAYVLNHHSKIAYLRKHTSFLERINEAEILKGECILKEFDTGQRFINQNHPYSSDLDIFGQHSIFQLLNRTTTESGEILLSEWLTAPALKNEILDRQDAIKELSAKLKWRQDFQASGMHFQNKKSDYDKLLSWVTAPMVLYKNRFIYTGLALILSILSLSGFILLLVNLDSPDSFIYLILLISFLVINYLILRKVKPTAENIVETAQENINTFRAYQALIRKIECENFSSKKLCLLQSILKKSELSAYKEINSMCRLLEFAQQRGINKIKVPIKGNAFYSLLNSFILLDIYLIIGVEKWKSRNSSLLGPWSEAVSEFEVLSSIAGFSYSNPSYAFPEISEKSNFLHFKSLGHPLINPSTRVCNDFHSEGKGDVVIITGSNMAGKSTFLRTAGVNLVLALAGAPCCADNGQVSNMKLFTSMRTQDNLKEGISSFYAELERIEKLLKLLESTQNVYFLLDEMFKGTNSEDRHKGGFSLINQITKLEASGIIATHDIELARLTEKRMLVRNYSFNSEIKDNSMHFSYKLHPGICNDFNATELMKQIGIKIISDSSNP